MKKRLSVGLLTACFLFAGMVGTTHAGPVQWITGIGANGHWYDVVVADISWSDAKIKTEAFTDSNSSDWHLATITSQAEQNFIASLLTDNTTPGDAGFQIGGFQPTGSSEPSDGWEWVTGETFSYNSWGSTPEPNNGPNIEEDYLYVDERFGWKWNDYIQTSNYYNPTGYIAEAPSAVPEPSTMLLLGSGLLGLVGLNRRRKA